MTTVHPLDDLALALAQLDTTALDFLRSFLDGWCGAVEAGTAHPNPIVAEQLRHFATVFGALRDAAAAESARQHGAHAALGLENP